jgi:hypothetical protein
MGSENSRRQFCLPAVESDEEDEVTAPVAMQYHTAEVLPVVPEQQQQSFRSLLLQTPLDAIFQSLDLYLPDKSFTSEAKLPRHLELIHYFLRRRMQAVSAASVLLEPLPAGGKFILPMELHRQILLYHSDGMCQWIEPLVQSLFRRLLLEISLLDDPTLEWRNGHQPTPVHLISTQPCYILPFLHANAERLQLYTEGFPALDNKFHPIGAEIVDTFWQFTIERLCNYQTSMFFEGVTIHESVDTWFRSLVLSSLRRAQRERRMRVMVTFRAQEAAEQEHVALWSLRKADDDNNSSKVSD